MVFLQVVAHYVHTPGKMHRLRLLRPGPLVSGATALGSTSQQLARSEIVVSCTIQVSAEQSRLRNRYPRRMRLGGSKAMAKVIEFYMPDKFRRRSKWIPPKQRGKVIQFPALQKKSA
jgi:hypothetical protein